MSCCFEISENFLSMTFKCLQCPRLSSGRCSRRGGGGSKIHGAELVVTPLPTRFILFLGHFIKLLNPIKHVVYFTSRRLLCSLFLPCRGGGSAGRVEAGLGAHRKDGWTPGPG